MWEQINRFYLTVRGTTIDTIWRRQPHEFFRSVKEAIHFFQGLTDSTLGHAEGWQFIQAGRFLERGNAIATLLGAYYERSARQPAGEADDRVADQTAQYLEWVGLLKSCTAFEAYCRVYTADVTPDRITEFLLLDPVFPHSVRFSIDRVQDALRAITEATGRRANERANRLAGRLQATLKYGNIEEIMADSLSSLPDERRTAVRTDPRRALRDLHQLSHRTCHGGLSTHHMEYGIRHITRFRYHAPVSETVMEIRLHPRTEGVQRCLNFALSIQPEARRFRPPGLPGQHHRLVRHPGQPQRADDHRGGARRAQPTAGSPGRARSRCVGRAGC